MNALLVESIQDKSGAEVFDTHLAIDRWKLVGPDTILRDVAYNDGTNVTIERVFGGTSTAEERHILDWEKEDYPDNNTTIPGFNIIAYHSQSNLVKTPIGVGTECNNGVWQFGIKGLYKIDVMLAMDVESAVGAYGATLKVSMDEGSTYIYYARLFFTGTRHPNNYSNTRMTHTISAAHFINVSSLDVRFKLDGWSTYDPDGVGARGSNITGDRSPTRGTSVSITRIGPAV